MKIHYSIVVRGRQKKVFSVTFFWFPSTVFVSMDGNYT